MVSIVNPAQIKDFGRSLGVHTRTDGVDSLVSARYGAILNPRAWTPPSPEARTLLQALLSRREAIAQDLQRERNCLEKADATETPPFIRQSILNSIVFLEKQLAKLQQDIDEHINRHPDLKADRDLLTSIPAVGPQVGNQHNPHIKALYQRLQEHGKTKMSALGAACASWCICASVYLKLVNLISLIMRFKVDFQDSIYGLDGKIYGLVFRRWRPLSWTANDFFGNRMVA